MTFVLNQRLVNYLIAQGYHYCLSKTVCINTSQLDVLLMLKPVKVRPSLKRLPAGFQTYFSTRQEPQLLAGGVDSTLALLELNDADAQHYRTLHNSITE